MYADDTSVSFCRKGCDDVIQSEMTEDLKDLNLWLIANRLSLSVAKTEFMEIVSLRQKLKTLGDSSIDIAVHNSSIKQVHHAKSLDTLSWSKHIEEISKKIAAGTGALKRVRAFIDHLTAIKIYDSLIEPNFLYWSSVCDGLAENLAEKLQKLQNRAARAIKEQF